LKPARAALLATACLLPVANAGPAGAQGSLARRPARGVHNVAASVPGGTIRAIKVEGNERIETGTILSYMLVAPGDPFDPERLDRSLKTLYATGLFKDVSLQRQGDTLVVRVAESPIVNAIAFEGNRKLTDEQLRAAIQLRPRAVFTPQLAEADRQRILDKYAGSARYAATVEPEIIHRGQNRVDVVFRINEGPTTLISRITFVGNKSYGENRLREVVASREQAFYRILSSSDEYDPERLKYDEELLRRFYLKNGFADVAVTSATSELSPDRRAFFVTFMIHEGERYKIGKVSVDSKLRKLPSDQLQSLLDISPGDTYDGEKVDATAKAITLAVQNRGYAFVDVKPRIARDKEKHLVDLVFDVAEAPRVFIERIDIAGNTRTQDKVIRREFRFAEGDPFNADAVRRTQERLKDLGYFSNVSLTPSEGSAADRAIVTANVLEKSTGEITLGGGFSSDAGALINAGLRERNLIGTGIDASLSGTLAQRQTNATLSVTDPYFLDRNLVAGFDIFDINNNNTNIAAYSEQRIGGTFRLGYQFNEHLGQSLGYSVIDRKVYNVQSGASIYVADESGRSLLSQVSQTLTLDYRDSLTDPRTGFVMRLGNDVAGLGGDVSYVRTKFDTTYFIPLERFTGDSDWSVALSAGVGYLAHLGGRERIIDRFFLGGDNLRGFQSGGAGPHSIPNGTYPSADSLGGRFIYTQSTELRFPLPISPDLGISGRAFVDVGGLTGSSGLNISSAVQDVTPDNASPRVGAGIGISWRSPFGLINVDLAQAVVKRKYDQTQFFRFGFGTRF
jgi:outer membrane protein insertion porin family